MTPTTGAEIVRLEGVTKRFPGVLANDRVDLTVNTGEIHAIVGENGAGKSTLMKILYGLYRPDAGAIHLRGQKASIDTPGRAVALGIGMVHQHFMLIPAFTVAENIVLGHEPTRAWLNFGRIQADIAELCKKYGFALDPGAFVSTLSVGEQQRVEILKVLYRGAEILILDEPTAVLVPQEVEELFANLKALKASGKTIIFISHKLDEVIEIADRVSVLRQGRMVGTVEAATTDKRTLAEMMVGRPVLFNLTKPQVAEGDVLLEADGLTVPGRGARPLVNRASFKVRGGQIYGIAGVEGNGQTELIEAIMGLRKLSAGAVRVAGQAATGLSPAELRQRGLAFIPEDRQKRGLVLPMTIWENLILGFQRNPTFSKPSGLKFAAIMSHSEELRKRFDIRLSNLGNPALALSGGNQQKVILAREFAHDPKVIIASQPTRGLDIGATEFVHQQILAAKGAGKAVLLVSADLEEVMSLADRIGVIYNGQIVTEIPADQATPQELGFYMTGGKRQAGEGATA
ncbi:MAG TPA: ABC transporter ATP-binding protein [Bacillota bacterium]